MTPELWGLGAAIVVAVSTVLVWKFAKLVLKLAAVVVLCVVAGVAVRHYAQTGALPLPTLPRYIHAR